MPRINRTARLPSAPLTEVIFELRWALQSYPGQPPLLNADPGLFPLIQRFTVGMKKGGFGVTKDLGPPSQIVGHNIARRFYKKVDLPFPLMQIGPGIFASNDGPLYEWFAFKAQTMRGLEVLLTSYPKVEGYELSPNYLELRYIDVFDASLLGSASVLHFLERGTSIRLQLPPFLCDMNIFSGDPQGRIVVSREVAGCNESSFTLDLGSAIRSGSERIVRMETKVRSVNNGVPKLKTDKRFLKEIDGWLESAHGITSPFFRDLMTEDVMKQFKKKKP
ncbi:MAG: TIGR04255 family protein [Dongiaceae bacterium]